MVQVVCVYVAITLVFVPIVLCAIGNDTVESINEIDAGGLRNSEGFKFEKNMTRRIRRKSYESKNDEDTDESLKISDSSISDSDDKKRKRIKKKGALDSSGERRGWRINHRKCTPCPEDMETKWRDPSISWICGAYQRARRSFKSSCMMYYRNCQDGTMFTKIADHRCQNDTKRHGEHFFYDYHVNLSDESSKTDMSESSPEDTISDSSDFRK